MPELISTIQQLAGTVIQQQKNIAMLCNEVKDLKYQILQQHEDLKDLRHVVLGTLNTPSPPKCLPPSRVLDPVLNSLSPPIHTHPSIEPPIKKNALTVLMNASSQAPSFQLTSMKGVEIQHALRYYKEHNLKDPLRFFSVIVEPNMRSKFKQVIVYVLHFANDPDSTNSVSEFLEMKRPAVTENPAIIAAYENRLGTLIQCIDSLFMEKLNSIEATKAGDAKDAGKKTTDRKKRRLEKPKVETVSQILKTLSLNISSDDEKKIVEKYFFVNVQY